jgi:type VI protein secretion system component Hcp
VAGTSDILMMLCKTGTSGIAAESQAVLGPNDTMLKGDVTFEKGKFFELDSFTMNINAEASDAAEEKKNPHVTINVGDASKKASAAGRKIGRNTTWNPGMLNPVSCTRQADHASPYIFEQCGKASPWSFAAIVRRKVVGGVLKNSDTDSFLMSYFRIDFTDVVITELGWSNDDEGIKETFQLVCSKAKVEYRQQMHTGHLATKQFPHGIWQK